MIQPLIKHVWVPVIYINHKFIGAPKRLIRDIFNSH